MVQAVLAFQLFALQYERCSCAPDSRRACQSDARFFRARAGVDELDDHLPRAFVERCTRVELTLSVLWRTIRRNHQLPRTFILAELLLHVIVRRAVRAQVVYPDH